MAHAGQLDQAAAVVFRIDLERAVNAMHFQQVVIPDMDQAVLKQALGLVDHAGQVFALSHIRHAEAVSGHILHQIAGAVWVIAHGQGIDLILLDQGGEPGVTIPIIDVAAFAQRKQPALGVQVVWQAVPRRSLLDGGRRQEEMRQNVELAAALHHDAAGGKVNRPGKVDTAHAVAPAKLLQGERIPAGPRHRFGAQPCLAAVLLDAAILGHKLHALGQGFVSGGDLIQHELHGHGHAQAGQGLAQLVDVVPLGQIVDHVQDGQEARFAAVAIEKRGTALDQLVINALILIPGRGDHQRQRLLARAGAGDHDLVLLEPAVAGPAAALVADGELRVVAVGLFFVEGDLADGGIAFFDVQVILARAGAAGKGWLLIHGKLEGRIHQIGLIQLGSHAINLRAKLLLAVDHIQHDARGQQRFSALAAHDHEHLAEMAEAAFVYQAEDAGNGRFLP